MSRLNFQIPVCLKPRTFNLLILFRSTSGCPALISFLAVCITYTLRLNVKFKNSLYDYQILSFDLKVKRQDLTPLSSVSSEAEKKYRSQGRKSLMQCHSDLTPLVSRLSIFKISQKLRVSRLSKKVWVSSLSCYPTCHF